MGKGRAAYQAKTRPLEFEKTMPLHVLPLLESSADFGRRQADMLRRSVRKDANMQHAMQVFHDEDNFDFRVIDRNGEPWFVLTDVTTQFDT